VLLGIGRVFAKAARAVRGADATERRSRTA